MEAIKNIDKLGHLISQDDLQRLDIGALLHRKHSNISFKVVDVDTDNYPGDSFKLVVKTEQGKSAAGNYTDKRGLIDLTRELFGKLVGKAVIDVQPIPYSPAPVEVVDTKWIQDKMLNKGVRIKDIVADTGIDKTNLSAWINGVRPMSQPVRAMFYYYLTR